MLKSQDCVVLVKLIAHANRSWSLRDLAQETCISLSEVHSGINRLAKAKLIRKSAGTQIGPAPILAAAEEYLIHGLKYSFPAQLGEYTRGISTGIGAPAFKGLLVASDEPMPVWPDARGDKKGSSLLPLYSSIPQSIREYPDPVFYNLLTMIDVIRSGRARERQIAINLLKKTINHEK